MQDSTSSSIRACGERTSERRPRSGPSATRSTRTGQRTGSASRKRADALSENRGPIWWVDQTTASLKPKAPTACAEPASPRDRARSRSVEVYVRRDTRVKVLQTRCEGRFVQETAPSPLRGTPLTQKHSTRPRRRARPRLWPASAGTSPSAAGSSRCCGSLRRSRAIGHSSGVAPNHNSWRDRGIRRMPSAVGTRIRPPRGTRWASRPSARPLSRAVGLQPQAGLVILTSTPLADPQRCRRLIGEDIAVVVTRPRGSGREGTIPAQWSNILKLAVNERTPWPKGGS